MDKRSASPEHQREEEEEEEAMNDTPLPTTGKGVTTIADAARIMAEQGRNRSPSPPRALFRSTTGKGVAFTEDDVTFLCKFLAYRK